MAEQSSVKDSGECFVINPTTRKVTIPYAHEAIGTVGDHLSEQITFKCPKMVDGHDISQCKDHYIAWINVHGEKGCDGLDVTQVDQDEEGMIYLTWTIRNSLTVAKGIVKFSVHFEDKDENGVTLYRWSTATCKDCKILDSVNAVLGVYEAVYVSGDALVFSDYTPVHNKTLSIETIGVVPRGTLTIKDGGTHDVGEYAEVEVVEIFDTPTIDISQEGVVTATANGLSSSAMIANYESNLLPENIKHNVNVLGVTGKQKIVSVDIHNESNTEILHCVYTEYDTNGDIKSAGKIIPLNEMQAIRVPLGSLICLYYDGFNPDNTYMVDTTNEHSYGFSNYVPIPANTDGGARGFVMGIVGTDDGVDAKIVIDYYGISDNG